MRHQFKYIRSLYPIAQKNEGRKCEKNTRSCDIYVRHTSQSSHESLNRFSLCAPARCNQIEKLAMESDDDDDEDDDDSEDDFSDDSYSERGWRILLEELKKKF